MARKKNFIHFIHIRFRNFITVLDLFLDMFSLSDLTHNLSRVENELNNAASKNQKNREILDEIKRKLDLLPSGVVYYSN